MATMKDDVAYVINKMTNQKYTESMFSQNAPEKTHESEKVFLKYYKGLGTELVNDIDKAFDVDYRLFGYKSLSALLSEESWSKIKLHFWPFLFSKPSFTRTVNAAVILTV